MYLLIIAIIFLTFIGLGSADALFGSAWPTIQTGMEVPLSYAGIVAMTITIGAITASLLSARLLKRFGAGPVATGGILLSSFTLLGFSFSHYFWMLCVLAFPLGFAGGTIDASLNSYVAKNYTSKHMNWLHCFWGLGAVVSPSIMGFALRSGAGWNTGYRIAFFIQLTIALILLASQPLWKKQKNSASVKQSPSSALKLSQVIRIKGVKYLVVTFFSYVALEATAGLWASTFLVNERGVNIEIAAGFAALFFIGITLGRFISGFISEKIGDKHMVRYGAAIVFVGIFAIWLPIDSNLAVLGGLIITGLGCAPIFPAVIHSTPKNFGNEHSQSIIGVQLASAYTGAALMPPLFGLIANHISVGLYPLFLLTMAVLMIFATEKLNITVAKPRNS